MNKALIVGLGKSGLAAVEALSGKAELAVQDSKAREELDKTTLDFIDARDVKVYLGEVPPAGERFDLLVLSPGVPPGLPFIQAAKEAGAEIIGELELAYRLGKGRILAITGTNGKTTTTTLVGEIVKRAGKDTRVVGNIGLPMVTEALCATEETWMVTEVSSYQLETIHDFKPQVSAILNLTPDHLNRHGSFEGYIAAKARIFENQDADGYFVYNYDDELCRGLAAKCRAKSVPFSRKEDLPFGAFVKDGYICVRGADGTDTAFCLVEELKIPGNHNLENALAATAIAYFAGIEPQVIADELRDFGGVEHRMEPAGEINGIRFVNDSKGTNPDAAIKAIEATKGKIIIIAGGYDKGSDFDEFVDAFGDKVRYALLLGNTAEKIKACLDARGFTAYEILPDMAACVRRGYELAEEGETVLLSPACASWDMYKNFEQRGEDFKECVRKLR